MALSISYSRSTAACFQQAAMAVMNRGMRPEIPPGTPLPLASLMQVQQAIHFAGRVFCTHSGRVAPAAAYTTCVRQSFKVLESSCGSSHTCQGEDMSHAGLLGARSKCTPHLSPDRECSGGYAVLNGRPKQSLGSEMCFAKLREVLSLSTLHA